MRRLVAALLVASTGCTSSTLITSRPERARVAVDGQEVGETPAQWSQTVWAFTRNSVLLSKEGYQDGRFTMEANDWQTGRVVVSVVCCFLPGLLWSTDYKPTYLFTLQPNAPWPGYGQPAEQQYPPQPGQPPQYQPQPQYQPPQQGYPPLQPQYPPPPQQQEYQPINVPPPPALPPPVRPGPEAPRYDPDGLLGR